MQEEFDALQRNRTWQLVPRPPRANIISGKWVFRHKTRPDGSLERYKARWVVRGFRQRAGVDFTDTFAPVVKPGTGGDAGRGVSLSIISRRRSPEDELCREGLRSGLQFISIGYCLRK